MELNTFVTETLKEIIEGIGEAQQYFGTRDIIINPIEIHENKGLFCTPNIVRQVPDSRTVQIIDFEITLGKTKGGEAKGSIGVLFANVGAGIMGKIKTENNTLNRVKFSIPVAFPVKKTS